MAKQVRPVDVATAFVLEQEGRYIDHPNDPGGPTYAGVSLRAVVDLRDADGDLEFDLDGDGDVDRDDIIRLGKQYEAGETEKVVKFYEDRYWTPAGCDRIQWPMSLAQFDAAVNHGVKGATLMLQRAIGVTADGVIGQATIRAANRPDPHPPALFRRLLIERSWLYYQLSVKRGPTFYRGWMKRLFDLQAESLRVPKGAA